jgi:hypothetical protein
MHLAGKIAAVVGLTGAVAFVALPATARSLSVTVVGQDVGDPRWLAVEEAVEFWNRQLAGLGVELRMGPVARLVRPVPDDALIQMSRAIINAGGYGPRVPSELDDVPGDIVVALSTADLISFGRTWRPGVAGLVGVKRADLFPLSLPNVPRNLIAHELGHVLGLRHNSDPAMLMCGRPAPCRPDLFASSTPRFFPLTTEDTAALRARW